MLKGRGDAKALTVNGQPFNFDSTGQFNCGLVLKPGKNLVEIKVSNSNNKLWVKKLRLLHLVSYPDMDVLYEGQPHWAKQAVVYLSTLGFIEGEPDDNFYPGNPISRGTFATWLARVKKLPLTALTADVYYDVPKEHWRAPYIKAVVDAGYMKAYDNQTFGIDDPLSRRQAAAIATQAEGIELVKEMKSLFVDVKKLEKNALPIYIAKEKGLIKGVSADLAIFEPDRALTRAEAAVLLSRFQRSHNAVNYIFNFAKGFSTQTYCGLNVVPQIIDFTIQPSSLKRNRQTNVGLMVKVAPREGFLPLAKVTVDLGELGGPADAIMFDDGTGGDKMAGDFVYTLGVALEPKTSGNKTLRATVTDKLGWHTEKEAQLEVVD